MILPNGADVLQLINDRKVRRASKRVRQAMADAKHRQQRSSWRWWLASAAALLIGFALTWRFVGSPDTRRQIIVEGDVYNNNGQEYRVGSCSLQ